MGNREMNVLVRSVALSTSVVLAALVIAANADARPLRYRAAPTDCDYSVSDPRYQHHIIPQVIGRDTKGDMFYHH
jgi:hypothetical protein